jgi:adenylate cyclase class IV
MARNIEIKARLDADGGPLDLAAVATRAAAVADGPPAWIEQDDTFFHAAHGRLKLRTFADGTGELIAYERADAEGPKASDYVRVAAPEPAALRHALARACGVRGRVRKRRQLWMAGATRIHLDRVEGLGAFIELEVVLAPGQDDAEGEATAHRLLGALGIGRDRLLRGAYLDLLAAATPPAGTAKAGAAPAPHPPPDDTLQPLP